MIDNYCPPKLGGRAKRRGYVKSQWLMANSLISYPCQGATFFWEFKEFKEFREAPQA